MHPILLKIGSITLYSYGFMIALAFLFGISVAAYLARKEKIHQDIVLDLALFILLGSIVGARVFYVLEFWGDFVLNPISVFYIWEGGLVFYGGLVFAVGAVFLFSKLFKIPVLKLLDLAAPGTALGYAIGRIGCFMRGCCYGAETNVPWAVHFPEVAGLRHPTQIYASLAGLLIFGVLLLIFYRKKIDGQVFSAGLMMYAFYRFTIEFIRVNPRYLFNLSEAQWGSVVIFIAGLSLFIYLLPRNPRR